MNGTEETLQNICNYCKTDEDECGEYRECCYDQFLTERKNGISFLQNQYNSVISTHLKKQEKNVMIYAEIDEMTPCLRNNLTGELVDTEVVKITKKSILKSYNTTTGWYVNWSDLLDTYEIFAIKTEDSHNFQGLVAVKNDNDFGATYIAWLCAAPENQPEYSGKKMYLGVGGHLFAIAAKRSIENGFEGFMYGFAANHKLLSHYQNVFNAEHLGILHPYHFFIDDANAKKIVEVYSCEWTETSN